MHKNAQNDLPTVVVIGAGFAGMNVARELADAPVRVVLLDRQNYHLFQPLLYQVATAGLEPEQITMPVRAIFRSQRNLTFRMAEVTDIDLDNRQVHTRQGAQDFDYLVVAAGAENYYFDNQHLARHALGFKDLREAESVRNQILTCFELAMQEPDPLRRRALLTFVVVGGGPTGVELAGALSELIRLVLVKDFPQLDLEDVRVTLLEATGNLLRGFPAVLQQEALQRLRRKAVEVRLKAPVEDFDGQRVRLQGGEVIPSRTLIWAAGVRGVSLLDSLGVRRAAAGRVPVEASLQLPGRPQVYVIGDAAYREDESGDPLPMMAPVAIQMARRAADNIQRSLRGEPAQPFEFRDPGSLATIGRNAAVARIAGRNYRGFVAWILWLVVHLIQLIGFRNRLLVLINWAWDYLFYDRAVRLITSRTGAPAETETAVQKSPQDRQNRRLRV